MADCVEARRFNNLGTSRFGDTPPLQNIPPPARFVWINVYENWESCLHNHRKDADEYRRQDLVYKHLIQVNIDTGETKVHAP